MLGANKQVIRNSYRAPCNMFRVKPNSPQHGTQRFFLFLPCTIYFDGIVTVDGSRSHPTADVDHGGGDAVAMVGTSTLINRELLEAEKLDVLGIQNSYKTHWGNLEEGKVILDGIQDVKGAMIFETKVYITYKKFILDIYF